jgi:hypothetical protein
LWLEAMRSGQNLPARERQLISVPLLVNIGSPPAAGTQGAQAWARR